MEIQNISPEEQDINIRKFIQERKPHLFILTPVYGGMCHINYLSCLMSTKDLFSKMDCPLSVEFCKNDSLVSRARNNLIAKAMTDPSITHMMFIDNDITWNPSDIMKLILSNKELIGGIYPLKHYEWSRLMDPKFIQRKIQRTRRFF
jgi:hypothetical protein